MFEFNDHDAPQVDEVVSLYDAVGWSAYTADPAALLRAVENSTYVVTARDGAELVGLARGLSDDVSIFYLQDVLVHPDRQGAGLGRQLIERCLERFAHVRQRVLLTDDEERQHRLYRSVGYHDVASLKSVPLHAFVAIKDVELD